MIVLVSFLKLIQEFKKYPTCKKIHALIQYQYLKLAMCNNVINIVNTFLQVNHFTRYGMQEQFIGDEVEKLKQKAIPIYDDDNKSNLNVSYSIFPTMLHLKHFISELSLFVYCRLPKVDLA